jgi:hypothetical protein
MWSEEVAISGKSGSQFSQVCMHNINQLRADHMKNAKGKKLEE